MSVLRIPGNNIGCNFLKIIIMFLKSLADFSLSFAYPYIEVLTFPKSKASYTRVVVC